MKKEKPMRLEDFIDLAKKGEEVRAEVELERRMIKEELRTGEEVDAYVLVANYTLMTEKQTGKVSKIYMGGLDEEDPETSDINRRIANERLKMDYQRLRVANINLEEKFFD